MADYREISQTYAQGAVNAAILINAGAAVALLSQAADLVKAGLASAIWLPMISWASGTALAAAAWILGFLSSRFVDKHEREKSNAHLRASDRFMHWGLAAVCSSLLLFEAGCTILAWQFPASDLSLAAPEP
ncbi:MAG TPA: hypothetical protein VGN97_16960 [Mesorhizobium sp.]|jgi:hypothetical protein|nr:hypothetical protein [Mesorhizobium sp.]